MDVVLDAQGRIWVASLNNSAIEIYELEEIATAVEEEGVAGAPQDFRLLPNSPNPFYVATWIPFELRSGKEVRLVIYDPMGRQVRAFDLGRRAGRYDGGKAVFWDGRDGEGRLAAAGIYFVALRAGARVLRRKMVLMR